MSPLGKLPKALVALLATAAVAMAAPAHATARFAVVVGNNIGGAERPKLWFAEKDADRFARTLIELGDFAPDRVTVLKGRTVEALREALVAVDAKVKLAQASGEKALLVFYYSGHAGTGGLELAGEKLPFVELRDRVARSPALTRVAIVDACEAGLLTQVKGATAAPTLDFALPVADTAQGVAFIASTAVGEQAQESAAIGGSFFTHHLEAALRGAGDRDGDRQVTLAEAFRYTSSMTIAGTATTQTGPQHPTYEFKMSGRGDVVLADLRRAEAHVKLPPDVGATYYFRLGSEVVAEVPGGLSAVSLGLPAGSYVVERRSQDGLARGSISLAKGTEQTLPLLSPTRYELARSKGGPSAGLLFAGVGAGWLGLSSFVAAPSVSAGFRQELGPIGVRARLGYGLSKVVDQGLTYDYSLISAGLAGLVPVNVGRALFEAGVELGYGYAQQRLPDRRTFAAGVGQGAAVLMFTAPVGPVRLGFDASVGGQLVRLNGARTVLPTASASLLFFYGI